jgi:hypothetical protein
MLIHWVSCLVKFICTFTSHRVVYKFTNNKSGKIEVKGGTGRDNRLKCRLQQEEMAILYRVEHVCFVKEQQIVSD